MQVFILGQFLEYGGWPWKYFHPVTSV